MKPLDTTENNLKPHKTQLKPLDEIKTVFFERLKLFDRARPWCVSYAFLIINCWSPSGFTRNFLTESWAFELTFAFEFLQFPVLAPASSCMGKICPWRRRPWWEQFYHGRLSSTFVLKWKASNIGCNKTNCCSGVSAHPDPVCFATS